MINGPKSHLFSNMNKENCLFKEKCKPIIIGRLNMHCKIKYAFWEKMLIILALVIYAQNQFKYSSKFILQVNDVNIRSWNFDRLSYPSGISKGKKSQSVEERSRVKGNLCE